MPETILSADHALQRQTLLWSVLLAALGLAGISYLTLYLDGLTALQLTDPQRAAERYIRLLLLLAAGDALIACSLGGVLIYFSCRVLRSGQFPPPGMRVIWDIRLRTGKAARLVAIAGMALAVAAVVAGLWLSAKMVWVWRGRDLRHLPGPIQAVMLQTGHRKTIMMEPELNLTDGTGAKPYRGASVSKIIPFRPIGKRKTRKFHSDRARISPTCRTEGEEGMVAIQLKDGTWKTITGSNLEMDVEYRDGVPYLVVRARR